MVWTAIVFRLTELKSTSPLKVKTISWFTFHTAPSSSEMRVSWNPSPEPPPPPPEQAARESPIERSGKEREIER
ncbi:MAG: hypothetical protein EXS08_04965 [Planctomycetes bacterium]|nr:hypothetical protein [Planctomycetota bacterium]